MLISDLDSYHVHSHCFPFNVLKLRVCRKELCWTIKSY